MAAVTAHLIDIRTGNRLAVGIRYGQFGRHPGNGLLTGELIACRHGDDLFRTGEGISRSGFGIARDSVAALRHRAFQLAVRCGVLGDIDDEIAQLGNIVVIRVLRTGTHRPPGLHSLRLCDRDFGKSLCQSALVQCQRIVAAEWLDLSALKILRSVAHGAEIHRQFCLCDRLASVIYDSKDVVFADLRRLGLGQNINGRLHPLCVLHTEGACFGGHVAVEVLEPDSERMRAVTERHALEVEGTVIDLQLAGIVRTVQQHADTAGIDAGGILIGHLAVGVDGIKGKIAAVQHGGAVSCQRRTGGSLGDRFQHRPGNIVGIRAVDELEIIDVKIAGTLGAVLGGCNTNCISARNIHGHLERGNIRFDPGPVLARPVAERTAAYRAVGIVAVVLNVSRRTVELLSVNIADTAVVVELHVGGIQIGFKRAALQNGLQNRVIARTSGWHFDPHADFGRLRRVDKKVTREAKVCRCNRRRLNIGEIIAKLERVLTETDILVLVGTHNPIIPLRKNDTRAVRLTNPKALRLHFFREKLPTAADRRRTDMAFPVCRRSRITVILKVHQHKRLHTNDNINRSVDIGIVSKRYMDRAAQRGILISGKLIVIEFSQ